MFNRAGVEPVPTERIDPGDGFLFRHGWTVAWIGWQWDVIRSLALMGIDAPTALDGGRPIAGQTMCEFQPNTPSRTQLMANRVHHPYPVADRDDPRAELTVRDWADGPTTLIPRDRWRFARDEGGRPLDDDQHVWLDDGFEPGRYYTLTYRTATCPVVGTGLLAYRDTAAFLRHADASAGNPAAGRLDRTVGFGVSQSGRFLRHFLFLGLNVDEAGRRVYDGLLPHVAGGRRGEFNHRFAQPSVQATRSFGHLPPFALDEQVDPETRRRDGLLSRQRAIGGVPKIILTNTSAEYWRGDCSLIHTDSGGAHDVEPPDEARIYHFAGTQHGPGALPLNDVAADGGRGGHSFNVVDYAPLLRAALANLDGWLASSVAPPPSRFPRLGDGTAVAPARALEPFGAIPGATVPDSTHLIGMPRLDLGPAADDGVGRFPPTPGRPFPTFRPAVDADRNELGGIRLPDLAVPVASYTGWNPRHPSNGGAEQIMAMIGSTFPLAPTAAERERNGDPRPSIAERYRDRADYLARVRAAAERLVAERYLLAEDVDLVVRTAGARYDAFARQPAAVPA
jgi:hypothetical protein